MATKAMNKEKQVEHYRRGYPRLAAFLLLAKEFTVVKRFDYLHMRIILELQDELAELQDQLHNCDDTEPTSLNLSSRRQDSNLERREIIKQIQSKLSVYDEAVQQFHQMKSLPQAQSRHLESIENWFDGTKPLVRSESGCYHQIHNETDYITFEKDRNDRAYLEILLELGLRTFPKLGNLDVINDDNIHLLQPSRLALTIKVFIAIATPAWLIFHVVLLLSISQNSSKIAAMCIFITATSLFMVLTTDASKYKLILAILT
ncbi:hypothetical protein GGS24DRAFT_495499 [Hypoxylon argillaceum]|nr:hypothetical protein GGS24DRAFT_495499 [Hypoxylon argillaceum]